jgi:hypothetical protein
MYYWTLSIWIALLARNRSVAPPRLFPETGWGRGLVRTCRAGETAPQLLRVRDEEKYGLELTVCPWRGSVAPTRPAAIPQARAGRASDGGDETRGHPAWAPGWTCSGGWLPASLRDTSGPNARVSRSFCPRRPVDSIAGNRGYTTGCGASLLTAHSPVVKPQASCERHSSMST